MDVILRHAECVTRRHEWRNRRPLLRFFYSFLWSRLIFFCGVFLGTSLSVIHPKKTDAAILPLDVSFRPAVLGPQGTRFPGRPNVGCCYIPSVFIVSSRRFPLVFRPCYLIPSVGRLLLFIETVLSKVTCAPTAPARKVAVVSSFVWGLEGGGEGERPFQNVLAFVFRNLTRHTSGSCRVSLRISFAVFNFPRSRRHFLSLSLIPSTKDLPAPLRRWSSRSVKEACFQLRAVLCGQLLVPKSVLSTSIVSSYLFPLGTPCRISEA
jgi:hypothetical protein